MALLPGTTEEPRMVRDCALHVQHKNHIVFDEENRIIPNNVVAVCTDTRAFRFGDGKTHWRDLPQFAGTGSISSEPEVGYSGALHVSYMTFKEIMYNMENNVPPYTPSASQVMVIGSMGVVFGNGVDNSSELGSLAPTTPSAN